MNQPGTLVFSFLGACASVAACVVVACGQRPVENPPSVKARPCNVADAPRPPGAPCSVADFAPAAPDLYDDGTGAACRQETQLYGGPASPAEPSGHELVNTFGLTRRLAFCDGEAALAELGWQKQPIQLTFSPGEREAITRCPGAAPRMSIELSTLRLEPAGSTALVSTAALDAQWKPAQFVRVFASAFESKCGLQVTAWARDDRVQACLSVRDQHGAVLYASFGTHCDEQ